LTRNRRLAAKTGVGTGWEILWRQGGAGADAPNFEVTRATTNATAQGAAGTVVTGVWYDLWFTYDETDGARVFKGTPTAPPSEISYNTRTVGSGATNTNSTAIAIGNDVTFATAFQGRSDLFELYSRRLELSQIRDGKMAPVVRLPLGVYGSGVLQPNVMGGGNHGLRTGATLGLGSPQMVPPSVLQFRPFIATPTTAYPHYYYQAHHALMGAA
jgi:hypothetical protein